MIRSSARVMSVGLLLTLVYLAVLVLTLGHRAVLPLFDGFGPPPRYQWVQPPAGLAAGNRVPAPKRVELDLGPAGSAPEGVTSDDAQLVLNLPAGAIPAAPPAQKASVTLTPLDSAGLAPLPGGAPADGNAYRLEIAYVPGGAALATLAAAGSALLTVPESAAKVFGSPDGQRWTELELVPVDSSRISFRLAGPGYVLASAAPIAAVPGPPSDTGAGRTVLVAGATVVLAALLFVGPALFRRVQSRKGAG